MIEDLLFHLGFQALPPPKTLARGPVPRAEIFRAELALVMPRDPAEDRPLGPTRVFPVGQPDKTLALVRPRFASLDVLEAVRSAAQSGQSLVLRVETTCRGVARLEVSCLNAPPPARTTLLVSNMRVAHRGRPVVARL